PAAARLAEDRDVARIAAEGVDVVPHPLERHHDVLHPHVARLAVLLAASPGEVEKAERVEAMRDRHDNGAVLARELLSVVEDRVAGAGAEAAAVEPDHHRP